MLTFSFDWQYHRSAFVVHDDSEFDIAGAILAPTTSVSWIAIMDNSLSICCNLLADALLVSRSDVGQYYQCM